MALPADLGFATVPDALRQSEALTAGGTLDLSAVARADSAGIALLLELSRRAQARGKTLIYTGTNAQVRALIGFFGVADILRLA
ncbi:MAG: STAS domain-containing protein [Stenotrophobium sp.]